MVAVKSSTYTNEQAGIEFTHFVDFPRRDYIIGTAKDKTTSKTKVYLIFNNHGRIYNRNGLNDTWIELENDKREEVHQLAENALKEQSVPRFTISNN